MSETVTITALSGDEEFTAYVARPAGSPRAAIVVIQEIFGGCVTDDCCPVQIRC